MARLLAALLTVAALAGCTSPCEELGNRLCECRDSSVSKRSCETTVRDDLRALDPSKDEEQACEDALDVCKAPDDVAFCEWVRAKEGKIACGLALPECAVDADCGTGASCVNRVCVTP